MIYKAGERYEFRVMYVDPQSHRMNVWNGVPGAGWYMIQVTGLTKMPLTQLKGRQARFVCRDLTEKGPEFVLAPEYFAAVASGRPAVSGPLARLTGVEEGQMVEFKTSIIFSPETHQPDSQQPFTIAKEIAAFMNSDGGTLYLGVRNDGTVVGIEQDFGVLDQAPIQERQKDDSKYHYTADRDGYAQKVRNLILGYLGGSASALIPDLQWHEAAGRTYATLKVPPTGEDIVYLGSQEMLVFRTGPQTAHLFGRQRDQYTKVRFHNGKVVDFEKMLRDFRDSLLEHLGQSEGVALELNENESVPMDAKHVKALSSPGGLVFDGRFRGEAKTWSKLYLRVLETLATVEGEKFEGLPDEPAFVLQGGRVTFDRKTEGRGKGRHLNQPSGYLGPKGDIRAALDVGTRTAFMPPKGRVFKLIEYFGLKPDQFRIWTGPGQG